MVKTRRRQYEPAPPRLPEDEPQKTQTSQQQKKSIRWFDENEESVPAPRQQKQQRRDVPPMAPKCPDPKHPAPKPQYLHTCRTEKGREKAGRVLDPKTVALPPAVPPPPPKRQHPTTKQLQKLGLPKQSRKILQQGSWKHGRKLPPTLVPRPPPLSSSRPQGRQDDKSPEIKEEQYRYSIPIKVEPCTSKTPTDFTGEDFVSVKGRVYQVQDVSGDGSCLYHALLKGVASNDIEMSLPHDAYALRRVISAFVFSGKFGGEQLNRDDIAFLRSRAMLFHKYRSDLKYILAAKKRNNLNAVVTESMVERWVLNEKKSGEPKYYGTSFEALIFALIFNVNVSLVSNGLDEFAISESDKSMDAYRLNDMAMKLHPNQHGKPKASLVLYHHLAGDIQKPAHLSNLNHFALLKPVTLSQQKQLLCAGKVYSREKPFLDSNETVEIDLLSDSDEGDSGKEDSNPISLLAKAAEIRSNAQRKSPPPPPPRRKPAATERPTENLKSGAANNPKDQTNGARRSVQKKRATQRANFHHPVHQRECLTWLEICNHVTYHKPFSFQKLQLFVLLMTYHWMPSARWLKIQMAFFLIDTGLQCCQYCVLLRLQDELEHSTQQQIHCRQK